MPDQPTPPAPTPEQDIVEGLFADPTPPADKPVDNKNDKKIDNPTSENKDDKLDVDAIVSRAVNQAVERITPLINQSGNDVTRNVQLNTWLNTEDGKYFGQHKDFLKKAANDPRWRNIPIEQLPQIILKRESYAKIIGKIQEDATKQARDGFTGGTSGGRPQEQDKDAGPDYKNMSKEDFKKVYEENKKKIVRR